MNKIIQLTLLLTLPCYSGIALANPKEQLYKQYLNHCAEHSDINEHLPVLRELAKECESAVEIGIRYMVSTWAILQGLSENELGARKYIGIDLDYPPSAKLDFAQRISKDMGIHFSFVRGNDMKLDIESVDLLFIDSLHTYCHLTYELEKFAPNVHKYIALHDTSAPWGDKDDNAYHGDYSEYPAHFDKTKRGLWPAVEDFLIRHPEWSLKERRFNSHGFTILERVR